MPVAKAALGINNHKRKVFVNGRILKAVVKEDHACAFLLGTLSALEA